jgi:hypothetical protein
MPVVYIYESDYHCESCAAKALLIPSTRKSLYNAVCYGLVYDDGGSPVSAVFTRDIDNECGIYCGDCNDVLESHPDTDETNCPNCGTIYMDGEPVYLPTFTYAPNANGVLTCGHILLPLTPYPDITTCEPCRTEHLQKLPQQCIKCELPLDTRYALFLEATNQDPYCKECA